MCMKKTILLSIALFSMAFALQAQRYAIIDTKYILGKIPEYVDADKKLSLIGEQWQKEIDDKQTQLDKMYKNYEAEQFMLTDELKKKREDELFVKEKDIRELQKKRFGYEGDLFKERQKLVKPVQDKTARAWNTASRERSRQPRDGRRSQDSPSRRAGSRCLSARGGCARDRRCGRR